MEPLEGFSAREAEATKSKALVLIEKTLETLERLDHREFPTTTSAVARSLLMEVLRALRDPAHLAPVDPGVLYNKTLLLQDFVAVIERSSTEHIPWPLVGYCDQIWESFFGSDGLKIFYSTTPKHNYIMVRFTRKLSKLLEGVIPRSLADQILNRHPDLYCLQLASAEDQNLPLYANIGHEFGHALYERHKSDLFEKLNAHLKPTIAAVSSFFQSDSRVRTPIEKNKLLANTVCVLESLGSEAFCDLVGSLLLGPAFFLSLHEMSWGQRRDVFRISLSPQMQDITAYPSFSFRLFCASQWAQISRFCSEAQREFASLAQSIKTLGTTIEKILVPHDSDVVQVASRHALQDAGIIQQALSQNLTLIKNALLSYLEDCAELLHEWYQNSFLPISTSDVSSLLSRFSNHILPNIIPNLNLLGRAADFSSILNAAALYRLNVLISHGTDHETLCRQMGITDRLTTKALEVSFIHKEYSVWKNTSDEHSE